MTATTDFTGRAEDWLAVGLTCAPADRVGAETAVRRAYAAAGAAPPERVIWLGSPPAGTLAVALLGRADAAAAGRDSADVDVRAVWTELVGQGCPPGTVDLGRSVRSRLRTAPWAAARAALVERLGGTGFATRWLATAGLPWQQLNDRLLTPLYAQLETAGTALGGPLGAAARLAVLDAIGGQFDAGWLGAFQPLPDGTVSRAAGSPDEVAGPRAAGGADSACAPARADEADRSPGADRTDELLAALAEVAVSAGWWWAFERVAVLTERPTAIHRDNLGRLHHADGPALSYPDGYALYAWRGMPIPPEVVPELAGLTVERIRAQDNAEIRRVMLEYYGYDRFLRESQAQRVHADDCGVLWRVELPGDEPLVMVEVVNSTAEPDGTFRTYFLRVPPDTRTARAGVAWTFQVTEEQYSPLVQS